jgi:hypothetical protein
MCAVKKTILEGRVIRQSFGKGSKSEHPAFYLETDKAKVLIKKEGDNPFENNALQAYLNKTVRVKGSKMDYIFIVTEIEEIRKE